jgi:hypothetical protein
MTAAVASLLVVTILLRCLWLWQPERQLLLHQAHLRSAVERHDWAKIRTMVDADYADRWGHTRETGIEEARQALGQFFLLTVTVEGESDELTADGGMVTERWKIDGTGTEFAPMVEQHVNELQTPFEFHVWTAPEGQG